MSAVAVIGGACCALLALGANLPPGALGGSAFLASVPATTLCFFGVNLQVCTRRSLRPATTTAPHSPGGTTAKASTLPHPNPNPNTTPSPSSLTCPPAQAAVTDLLAEGRYTAAMAAAPWSGADLVSLVWGCVQASAHGRAPDRPAPRGTRQGGAALRRARADSWRAPLSLPPNCAASGGLVSLGSAGGLGGGQRPAAAALPARRFPLAAGTRAALATAHPTERRAPRPQPPPHRPKRHAPSPLRSLAPALSAPLRSSRCVRCCRSRRRASSATCGCRPASAACSGTSSQPTRASSHWWVRRASACSCCCCCALRAAPCPRAPHSPTPRAPHPGSGGPDGAVQPGHRRAQPRQRAPRAAARRLARRLGAALRPRLLGAAAHPRQGQPVRARCHARPPSPSPQPLPKLLARGAAEGQLARARLAPGQSPPSLGTIRARPLPSFPYPHALLPL